MLFNQYTNLSKTVPTVPEMLLDFCGQKSEVSRQQIIVQQRITTLISFIHEDQYPANLICPQNEVFSVIHSDPANNSSTATPQQLQFISFLVGYVKSNPQSVTKALETQLNDPHSQYFLFMCYSVIPSFFGFFSSREHINSGFSFYCSLVSLANEKIVDQALIPFFCNGCTFRFIEMVFYEFGLPFVHDLRLDSKQIQTDILNSTYVDKIVDSIIRAYPLIPQTHKFLLKFMIEQGRNQRSVLHFFLHRFAFPQLLRYIKGTPFTSHFLQLKSLMISLRDNINPCLPILKVFNSNSVFEVPSAFEDFDESYTQIVITPLDVHVMLETLSEVSELPTYLRIFRETAYFTDITYTPFWVKVFSRNPKPLDAAFNWRPVVFTSKLQEIPEPPEQLKNILPPEPIRLVPSISQLDLANSASENESPRPINELDQNLDTKLGISIDNFERIYLKIFTLCYQENVKPVAFLLGEIQSPLLYQYYLQVKNLLGQDSFNLFYIYTLQKETRELVSSARSFERYLVHSISLSTLTQWKSIVESNYITMILPIVHSKMQKLLMKKFKVRSSHDAIQKMILEAIDPIEQPPVIVMQTLFLMAIDSIVKTIPSSLIKKLAAFDAAWEKYILVIREYISDTIPAVFKNQYENRNSTIQLNQKLWVSIEHLKSINHAKFEWCFNIILETLYKLDEMLKITNNDNSLLQFAIVFCDNVSFITKFAIINILVVKQKIFDILQNETKDLFLWSRLESEILKLMSFKTQNLPSNQQLMKDFMALQDELMKYQIN